MADLVLLLIRHAEEPGEAWPGHGFTEQGEEDSKSLVLRGWQRAGAWAALLAAGSWSNYPKPDYLYAARPGEGGDPDHGPSRRPAETLQPLADRLVGVGLKTEYAQGQEADLVAELLMLSGVVLVSWEHKAIVEALVPLLPVSDGSPPTHWPGDRFDVILRFDRPVGAEAFTYRTLFPRLLSGDSDQGFDA